MGRTSRIAVLALAATLAWAAPARAEGLIAERVQATFHTSRKGLPHHTVKLRGVVTETAALRRSTS